MQKKLGKFVLFVCLLLPLVSILTGMKGTAAENDVQIVIHKRVLRDADLPEFTPHQNDGHEASQETDILSKTSSLDGAIFDVYDVTRLYQESGLEEQAFLEQFNEMSCKFAADFLRQRNVTPIYQGLKTDSEAADGGVLRFNVASYNQEMSANAVYLIVETGVDPAAGVTVDLNQTTPLVVMLPVLDPLTNQAMQTIHIYPKNISYLRSPYFFKIGRKTDGTELPLAGAVFVLYRTNSEGNREYLDMSPTAELKNKWIPSSDPASDPAISRYTSNSDGLVEMKDHYLPAGTYYLEEIQGVEGYKITEEQIPLVIPESEKDAEGNAQFVMINGQQMEEKVNDRVPESAMTKKEPRIYNDEVPKKELPNTKGDPPSTPTSTTSTSKFLPRTGEQRTLLLTGIGMLLLFIVGVYQRKQKRSKQ
ncbi:peptidase [Enterococcus florum]|uniref:Peptidase n=1 Tax=Enterococcus florum TaxID=2480627 RepID=A0A4P5PHY6_9ENTE|nr:pilin N-terminal domain-containing protein [Enterococcus florum]GCF95262.1 peptidase [Enterococcus florum]